MTYTPPANHADLVYLAGMEHILQRGTPRTDRTGVGTISVFGLQQRYDLQLGFPALTTKRVYPRGVFGELLFFLTGNTDNNWLKDQRIGIWDEWAPEDGDLGPIYGYQWRHFGAAYATPGERAAGARPGGVDQLMQVIHDLKHNPFSRRHIVSAWNPTDIPAMALPPCHTMFQFYVTPDAEGNPYGLSCQLFQRSGDYLLGIPFNVASYAALTQLIAELVGLVPMEFVHTMGDAHIYSNHFEQCKLQLSRRDDIRPLPTLSINHPVPPAEVNLEDGRIFDAYRIEDFSWNGYDPHPSIKAEIAV